MPEANYLLSVSWGYIKVGLIPEGLLIPELLMAGFFFFCAVLLGESLCEENLL